MDALSKTVLNCVYKYAPDRNIPVSGITYTTSWIKSKYENILVKRDRLFNQWIENLDEANTIFNEISGKIVTRLIRHEKNRRNFVSSVKI